jgi:hypothetical protein
MIFENVDMPDPSYDTTETGTDNSDFDRPVFIDGKSTQNETFSEPLMVIGSVFFFCRWCGVLGRYYFHSLRRVVRGKRFVVHSASPVRDAVGQSDVGLLLYNSNETPKAANTNHIHAVYS